MSSTRGKRNVTSLRFQLPLLLLLYFSAVAFVLYVVADRVQEDRFERDFERQHLLRATEVQSRTERAAERSELETAQREFGELRVFEEVRAAVFVSPENEVILSSRREWSHRPLDLTAFDLTANERPRVADAMVRARTSGRTVSQFSEDRQVLTAVLPAALPLGAGDLRVDRRALIVLVYDLGFSKSINSFRLRQQFAVAMLVAIPAVLGLGIALHILVTRRIERLHGAIGRFAAGEPMTEDPNVESGRLDEISDVQRHFTAIAASVAREIDARTRADREMRESIAERQRAEAELVTMNARYARQEAALTTLTRSYVGTPGDFTPIIRTITEVVARTLEVAQVGVWRYDNRGSTLRCENLYDWPDGWHSAGPELKQDECQDYFVSLNDADVMAVGDARSDVRTSSLASVYLIPHDITSLMSVPIRVQGAAVGVLSCTHRGSPRRWAPDEQTFALAVANLLAAVVAQVERLQLEQQLRQAQRLEAIGQLAGGVAHDFNNILTVILGRAEEASEDRRLPTGLQDALSEITQNAERATALTRQLLAFSRRQAIQMRDVEINSVVGDLARMLNRLLGEDVVADFTYTAEPTHIRADPGMIEQVVLNLAVNGRDAMPLGGHLGIETAVSERDSAVDATSTTRSWVCLTVTDTGSGIAREHLAHIFEPFFTTKDVGKGTGLGLATSYGIVQQHGGWIDVTSEIGRGTCFKVYFPRVVATVELDVSPAPTPSRSPRGSETILVVEDEEGVRSLVIHVLKNLGYRTLDAPSGPAAIDVWLRHGQKIDMLITDIVMPDGINGIELAERLRRKAPELRVIYMSGYLADVSRDDIPSSALDVYLAKPFSLAELAGLVRSTLDAPSRLKDA